MNNIKLKELYGFITEQELDRYVIEWAGIFRYLYSTKVNGFTKEDWKSLCSISLDNIIIDTLFRLLVECDLIKCYDNLYKIPNELDLQRTFEKLDFLYNINKNNIDFYEQQLLWTKASSLNIPTRIGREFKYLSSYLNDLICTAKVRIILFAPYYSSEGLNQLMTSFHSILAEDSTVKIDVIINDIENKNNNKAMDTLVKDLKKNYPDNCIRIFKANYKNEDAGLFFHAKLLLVDSKRGYMGSANFSRRALTEQLEIGVKLSKKNTKILECLIDYLIKENIFNEIKL